ncbi:MAG: hypothetical protein ACXWF0_17660, partial [Usitatibacter sp.]
ITIPQGGTAAALLPVKPDGSLNQLRMVQILGQDPNMTAQIVVSPCAGDSAAAVPAACVVWGSVWGSATQLDMYTSSTPIADHCTLTPGVTYYATLRNVAFDKVTPNCTTATCSLSLQYN